MNKKLITLLIALVLFIGYPVANISAATTTGSTAASKTSTVKKKVVTKKKVVKKKIKERLIPAPKPFTLETAPHSAKPIAKAKKKTTKVATKKKA